MLQLAFSPSKEWDLLVSFVQVLRQTQTMCKSMCQTNDSVCPSESLSGASVLFFANKSYNKDGANQKSRFHSHLRSERSSVFWKQQQPPQQQKDF